MKFSFVKHILKDNHEYNFTRLIDDILMKYDKYSITDNEIVQWKTLDLIFVKKLRTENIGTGQNEILQRYINNLDAGTTRKKNTESVSTESTGNEGRENII